MKIFGYVKFADASLNKIGIEKFVKKVIFKIQSNRQKEYPQKEMVV
jgi:hypothetical protein